MPKTAYSLLISMLVLAGCATTGATVRSGVGDALLEHPPFYAGASVVAIRTDSSRIGHLPIAYQRGASQSAMFDPKAGANTAVDALLRDMNAYLDSLGKAGSISVRLAQPGPVSAAANQSKLTPPDVSFGCVTSTGAIDDDCADRGDGALGRGRQPMRLAVGRPSAEWTASMRDVMTEAGVGRALVITLEVGQYLLRQTGLRGNKEVELGTSHTAKLPWLTSVETPVTVLQLTGALMGSDGRALRIGAEGFYVRRTALLVSAIGGQELIDDKDVEAVRSARRDDLPGRPLVWHVALRELVGGLTGRAALVQ
jgi:hypothetical protein